MDTTNKPLRAFLVISAETSTLEDGSIIDGENLAVVMATNRDEAKDLYRAKHPWWRVTDLAVRSIELI